MIAVHISLSNEPGGRVVVRTNDERPAVGRLLSPAQALSIDLLRTCAARANEVRFGEAVEHPAAALAKRLLDPEDLGHAATPEIRDAARQALGRLPVETDRRRL